MLRVRPRRIMRMANGGITLIELVVVMAIAAVLTSTISAQYVKYLEKAQKARDVVTAAKIGRAYQTAMIMCPEAYELFLSIDKNESRLMAKHIPVTRNGVTTYVNLACILASEDTTWTGKQPEYYDHGGQGGLYTVMNQMFGLRKGVKNASMLPSFKISKSGPHDCPTEKGADGLIRHYRTVDRWRVCKNLTYENKKYVYGKRVEVWVADDSKWGGWPIYRVWPEPDDMYNTAL